MTVTIYHNPKCGTSRNVLAMIRASGEEPEVIEYLKDPPCRERLKALKLCRPSEAVLDLLDNPRPSSSRRMARPSPRRARHEAAHGRSGRHAGLAWGSSYCLPAVLAAPLAADTGWPGSGVAAGLSRALWARVRPSP